MTEQAPSLAGETVGAYLDRLASSAPAPGGGAAVALTAAQAAALLAMVVNVSGESHDTGRARPGLASDLDLLRRRALELADEDAAAFEAVMRAYKLPKATAKDKTLRQAAVSAALKGATEVPLDVIRLCADLHLLAGEAVAGAKPAVISDAGIALRLLGASLKAASYNVAVNLKYLKDDAFRVEVEARAKVLTRGLKATRRTLLARVDELLKPDDGGAQP